MIDGGDSNEPRCLLVAGQRRVELKQFFGDNHLQLVDLGQIRESAGIFLTVEDLLAVQIDLQAALADGGELYGYVPGCVVAKELRRQPRGDREVPSSNAIYDFNVHLAVLRRWHVSPRRRRLQFGYFSKCN